MSDIELSDNPMSRTLIIQSMIFSFSIVILLVFNISNCYIEINRPVILLVASIFTFFNFQRFNAISIVQRVILTYMIGMFFNQLSARMFHIRSISVHVSLLPLVILTISLVCYTCQKPKNTSMIANRFFISWLISIAIIVIHMLFLFLLLKDIYGYGYSHDFAVLSKLCLYFLVFVMSWPQLANLIIRRISAMVFIIYYMVLMIKGF